MDKVLHSSKKQNWRTPEDVLDVVRRLGPIVLDPCASRYKRHWFAEENWTKGTLERAYLIHREQGVVYANIPYGRMLKKWIQWWCACMGANDSVLLTPSRTDTQWFNHIWRVARAYCFWEGRITFVGAKDPAPFPSVFFYNGMQPYKFCHAFQSKGIVEVLR